MNPETSNNNQYESDPYDPSRPPYEQASETELEYHTPPMEIDPAALELGGRAIAGIKQGTGINIDMSEYEMEYPPRVGTAGIGTMPSDRAERLSERDHILTQEEQERRDRERQWTGEGDDTPPAGDIRE